jgi:ABC-type transport system substrate-binding protein/class 3 adenylate cyclase
VRPKTSVESTRRVRPAPLSPRLCRPLLAESAANARVPVHAAPSSASFRWSKPPSRLRGAIEIRERPTGTVTFLFSDIEGSTRLLQQLRDRYDEVLSTHARLLRAAIEEFDGHEIDTQGDAFFVAFARARDAVAAAVAAQRALAAESWPEGASVRVRMGLHTGEPLVGGERYVGMGVNRGARICAAGHGGQVLLSNTTRELVEDELPNDVRVRDLGEHELKDLSRPERIFELEIDGLPSSFPPLRTAEASAFEGRESELARAAQGIARRRLSLRRMALVATAGTVIGAAVLVPLLLLGGSSETAVAVNSIVALDSSGSVAATVSVGARPVAIASGSGALWVANLDDRSVTRVDASSQQAVRTIPIGDAPTALAATRTTVWVTDSTGAVSKIDPRYDRLTFTRRLAPSGSFFGGKVRPVLAAFGSLWIVDPDGFVSRIDAGSARRTGSVGVGNDPSAIAAGAGSVWVTNRSDGTVTRIDPTTLVPKTIPVGHGPSAVVVNAAGAWIANAGDNALVRVDTETNAIAETTPVGDGPTAVLATPTALWVANGRDGTVMRLDPRSGKVSKTIRLGGAPDAFASAGGQVWVAIAPAPPQSPPAGGVARLTAQFDFASLDPALLPLPQVSYATCANLVTYPDKPAPEGSRIVPEVADAVPAPTAAGTTYTFRIRRGFRFSPPSNEAVTAMTFKSTIERVTNPRLKSPVANQFSGIVGYHAYVAGKAHELAGVVARGRTLTIKLSQPDGAFLANLATGLACAVPRDTPADAGGINDIPSAGPYYIASYTPRQQLVLRRNLNYYGDRPHRLDQIVVAIGVDPSRALEEIEAGQADYAVDGLPRDAGSRLASAYGPGSTAAKAGHQQYFISPALGAKYLHMNTSRPLFSRVRLRRAVNYAIDRPALVAQGRRFQEVNPFNAGEPTDDYIPPSVAGAADFHLYPVNGPNPRRAKRLAGRVRATAILYTPNLSPWLQEAQIIRRDLQPLGIDVQVKEFAIGDFFARLSRRGEPFDLAVSGYSFPPDPVQILANFDGSTIGPTNNSNLSYFDDPAFNRKLKTVAKLSGAKRYRAASRLSLELERDGVPAAAIAWNTSRDFFSARIGCQVYQPFYGMDLAALCLRP